MKHIGIALTLALVMASASRAATIDYVGADIDGTQAAWRTTSVAKPLDADGDNVYGTAGYLMPMNSYHPGGMPPEAYYNTATEPYRLNPSFATLEWAQDWSGSFSDWGEWPRSMDNPVSGGSFTYGGMYGVSPQDFVRVTLTSAGSFRLGVWIDGQNGGEYATALTVRTSDNSVTGTSATADANNVIDWYFWDVTGAAGDVFLVTATKSSGGWVDLGGITIDAIPEPATMSLLVLGGVAALVRRKRR
ncbi:MAG: PEP-CTERM sorting domain-containing protein [Planctomycetaceae bacterium]|nr:PEP-CTERM sorting domain-containing protein [Planctomycetaceae bacterium]